MYGNTIFTGSCNIQYILTSVREGGGARVWEKEQGRDEGEWQKQEGKGRGQGEG